LGLNFIPPISQFICNSEFTRTTLNETFRKLNLRGSTSVIAMPIPKTNGENILPSDRISQILEKIPKPFYLFLGRLNYDKGADIFLDLAKKYPESGFLICGEGPMLEELKGSPLTNLGVAGQVSSDEKPWLFRNCEALIIPSRTPETSSLVISESHLYGTPVVYPLGGGAEETFKRLGRVGCSLQEFTGQRFSKSLNNVGGTSYEDFGKALVQVLSASL
jgi:glycosyltransferase involved in cell wall biosynthesis